MTKRTIVGSGPARRPLPMGREAVERAIRMCTWWGELTCENAMYSAYEIIFDEHSATMFLDWLPEELRGVTVDRLRERLRSMP
jgi:hypothetical protein